MSFTSSGTCTVGTGVEGTEAGSEAGSETEVGTETGIEASQVLVLVLVLLQLLMKTLVLKLKPGLVVLVQRLGLRLVHWNVRLLLEHLVLRHLRLHAY